MLEVGTDVKIVHSSALLEMKLEYLVGAVGVIVEQKFQNKKNPGAFVQIKKGKFAGEEWFIPLKSLQTRELINRMRSANILKSFQKI